MKKFSWPVALVGVNLIVICMVMVRYATLQYPLVGHDYAFFLPEVLDGYLHFWLNGIGIQWYTSSFGGGIPAYPNPENTLYSSWTVLTALVKPFHAVLLSAAFFICLGGIATYYLLRRIFKLHWTASLLGMVFLSANGFMMQRLAVGHMGYQLYPLIAILLVAVADASLPILIAAILFALVIALLVQGAGFMLILIFGLSLLMVVCLANIYRPGLIPWKRAIAVMLVGSGLALVISISKLSAVYAFMRFFPRLMADHYQTTTLEGLLGILMQLLGTMNMGVLAKLIGGHPTQLAGLMWNYSGGAYGYWEYDMSLSPVVFGILLAGIAGMLRKAGAWKDLFIRNRRWLNWILLTIVAWITVELTMARGLVFPTLNQLPILSSLHVNVRFAAAFMLPTALCAAFVYNRWAVRWSGERSTIIVAFDQWKLHWSGCRSTFAGLVFNILTLIPLSIFFLIKPVADLRTYDVIESDLAYTRFRSGIKPLITGIVAASDSKAMIFNESNLTPNVTAFGYHLEYFQPELHFGSIWDVSDGYYNMTDPTGYVFPEVNGTRAFERIHVSDKDKLLAFAAHRQPDWKIPFYQQVLNILSGVGFWAVLAVLILWAGRRQYRSLDDRKRGLPTRGRG